MKPFKFSCIIELADQLCRHDETELALKALDLVPAYYRDHRIKEVEQMRNQILKAMQLPVDLQWDKREMPKHDEHNINFLRATARGQILEQELKKANEMHMSPHIVEYGGGDFTFCLALHKLSYRFSYFNHGFNVDARDSLVKLLEGRWARVNISPHQKTWFVAYEIIEHLADTREIRAIYERCHEKPEKIFLSTPQYCFGDGTDWEKDGIHHRRAYTPTEFTLESIKLFPEYDLKMIPNEVMVIVGDLKNEFK